MAYGEPEWDQLHEGLINACGEYGYPEYYFLDRFMRTLRGDTEHTKPLIDPLSEYVCDLDRYRMRRCLRELLPVNAVARDFAEPILRSLGFESVAPAQRLSERTEISHQ